MQEYAMYLRKSREDIELEAHGAVETLARHRAALTELAKNMKLNVTEVYQEVVSGDNIYSRPQMQRLLADVNARRYAGVLVMEITRLARGDTIDQGMVAQAFSVTGTKIITPNKIFDPSTDSDQDYFEFNLFMSRQEYKAIKRRMTAGRIASVKEGKYIGNVAPYGYRRVRLEHQKGYTLEPLPEEASVVRMIFEMYTGANRVGSALIARKLNGLGIKPRVSERWTVSGIRSILKNISYTGKVTYGRRKQFKTVDNGAVKYKRPHSSEYVIADALFEPLISEETYNLAQHYASMILPPVKIGTRITNPLAGLVKCGACGRAMVRRPYPDGKYVDTLICPLQGCKTVSSKFEHVETDIIRSLKEWVSTYEAEAKNIKTFPDRIKDINAQTEAETANLARIQSQLDRACTLVETGVYTAEQFIERQTKLQSEISRIKRLLKGLDTEMALERKRATSKFELVPRIYRLLDTYDTSSPEEKNRMLREVIDKAVYTKTVRQKRGSAEDTYRLEIYPAIPDNMPFTANRYHQ